MKLKMAICERVIPSIPSEIPSVTPVPEPNSVSAVIEVEDK